MPKANSGVAVSFYPPRDLNIIFKFSAHPQAAFQTLLKLYQNAANGIKNSTKLKNQPKCSNYFHCGVLKQFIFHYLTFFAPAAELAFHSDIIRRTIRTAW